MSFILGEAKSTRYIANCLSLVFVLPAVALRILLKCTNRAMTTTTAGSSKQTPNAPAFTGQNRLTPAQ